jgi:NitT/TauT family transport system substrate-binding protein
MTSVVLRSGIIIFSLCLFLPTTGLGSESKSVIIGEPVRGIMYAPLYIAEARGFFRNRGLDTKIVTFTGATLVVNSVMSGSIQFAGMSPDGAVRSSLAGFHLKMIMGLVRGLNLALAVQPDIRSAADLKGKVIAISDFSGLPYTATLLILKQLGLSKGDVTLIRVGDKALRYQSLITQKVHGAILDPPYTSMAERESKKLIVDLGRLNVPYLRTVIAVAEQTIVQDRSTVAKLVEAICEGIQFYKNKENKDESINVLAKYLRVPLDKKREIVEGGYETYWPMTQIKPYPDPEGLRSLLATIADADPKAKEADPSSFVDTSFIKTLDERRFFKE